MRVVCSDLRVGDSSNDCQTVSTAPRGRANGDLSTQEKALELMPFDLSACVVPDTVPPGPPPEVPPQ